MYTHLKLNAFYLSLTQTRTIRWRTSSSSNVSSSRRECLVLLFSWLFVCLFPRSSSHSNGLVMQLQRLVEGVCVPGCCCCCCRTCCSIFVAAAASHRGVAQDPAAAGAASTEAAVANSSNSRSSSIASSISSCYVYRSVQLICTCRCFQPTLLLRHAGAGTPAFGAAVAAHIPVA